MILDLLNETVIWRKANIKVSDIKIIKKNVLMK